MSFTMFSRQCKPAVINITVEPAVTEVTVEAPNVTVEAPIITNEIKCPTPPKAVIDVVWVGDELKKIYTDGTSETIVTPFCT